MSIKTKILIPVISLAVLVAGAILVSNIKLFSDFVGESTRDRVFLASKTAAHHLADLKTKAAAVSLNMTESQAIVAALADHDRAALMAGLQHVQDKTGADFCTVTDPGGVVIARTHAPEKRGDSIAHLATFKAALAGERLAVIESGNVVRLAARSALPVVDDGGEALGVIFVGYRLDTPDFASTIKEVSGCEITVLLGDERIATTLPEGDHEHIIGTTADPDVSRTVLAGADYIGEVDILGHNYFSMYTPIAGPDGRAVGMLFAGRHAGESAKTIRAFVKNGFWVTLVLLAVFAAVVLVIVRRIVAPIHAMVKAATALALGDTDIDVRADTRDEMRVLADAFNEMIANSRRQIKIIEEIANGNCAILPKPRSDNDVMNRSLARFCQAIQAQSAAIREEHERVRIMLDATPLASRLWNRDIEMVACNEAAVKLFRLENKQEYIDRYFELSPEIQPDGRTTREKLRMSVAEAFDKGACTHEWMYRLLDGTPVPAENTMVRVPYGDDYAVAAYSRDLREQNRMMGEIRHRDNLLNAAQRTAYLLFNSAEAEDIDGTLRESMEIMGRCVGAQQVYLGRDEVVDGLPCFLCKNAWADEARGDAPSIAPGVRIPWSADPEWDARLHRGECMNGPVKDLPEGARNFFLPFGARSVLVIPVFVQEHFWGVVGFSDCGRERSFGKDETDILRSMSLMMAAAVNRNAQAARIRQTSAQLEAALDEARKASNAKSDFLASISHEMRTPLNAILGLSEIALDNPALDRESRSNIERIYNSGSVLLNIINDLLDISKVQAGKFVIRESQYDLPSLINDAVLQNVFRIGSKPVRFFLNIDENLPARLLGDELRVKQIINNLLSNAIKYTQEGEVELALSCEREGETVWLTIGVRDTGIGLKPEHLERLFTDYTQFGSTSHQQTGGTGLGLVITKSMAELMGGSIRVDSAYGKGSAFTVRIRQRHVDESVIGPSVAESLKSFHYSANKLDRNSRLKHIPLPYARVLVVDDNITNLDVARGLMRPYGMRIDCVTGGREAIHIVRNGKIKYDAIFMDHMMPGMDGVEATRIIRQEIGTSYARTVPIIALTANAITGNEEMFLQNGFQAFISKPIDLARLDEVIRRFVRDKTRESLVVEPGARVPDPGERDDEGGHAPGFGAEAELAAFAGTIDGLDIAKGIERYGDAAALQRILYSYKVNTHAVLASIEGVGGGGEIPANYAITMHGLKGASRNICAEPVGALAEALERAAKDGDAAFVARNNPTFLATARKLTEDIGTMLDDLARAHPKPKKDKPSPADLSRLCAACDGYDFTAIDAIMEKLEGYEYTADGGLVAWLRENVTKMDYAPIIERLSAAPAAGDTDAS